MSHPIGEIAPIRIRQRLRVPPIHGRGKVRPFRVDLHEGGVTSAFLVGAFKLEQAAGLLRCSVPFLKLYRRPATDEERDRAEVSPGRVWVRSPGDRCYRYWTAQAGAIWV